jgi:hypothetical protein
MIVLQDFGRNMMISRFSLLMLCFFLLSACGGTSYEYKMLTSYFDSLYRERSVDTLLARMLPFFASDVRERRLPVYSAQIRFSERFKSHEIYGWRSVEKNDRLTISASLREYPRQGNPTEKGFIARFAKQYSPDGRAHLWMLYDMVFSSRPVQNADAWLQLVDLSPVSRTLLSTLTNDVSVLVFGRIADDPVTHVMREIAASMPGRVTFSYHDPDRDRGLAAGYGIVRTPHIVIENGERRAILQVSDLYWDETQTGSDGQVIHTRLIGAEQRLVSAFLRVAGPPVHAVFIEGLGERTGARALSRFAAAVSNNGYVVKRERLGDALSLTNAEAQKRLFIFADPRSSPNAADEARLIQSLSTGAAQALFLFDTPVTPWAQRLGANFGIRPLNVTVLDPANKDSFKGPRWIESFLSMHESTVHFANRPNVRVLIGEGVGSLLVRDFSSSNFMPHILISSGKGGWGSIGFDPEKPDEIAFERGDIPGPLHFGFAVTAPEEEGKKQGRARAVAAFIGDADFVSNELLQSRISNWLFTADILSWLTSADAHAIPPRRYVVTEMRQYQ